MTSSEEVALPAREAHALQAFRRVAASVRNSSVVDLAYKISVNRRLKPIEGWDESYDLLPEEQFRSLSIAVRQALLQKEPAHFYYICNTIEKYAPEPIRLRAREVRATFQQTMNAEDAIFHAVIFMAPVPFTPLEIVETWLYSGVIHNDADRAADYQALSAHGKRFTYAVQSSILLAAGRILDLDDILAEWLHEPPLPRLTAPATTPPAA